MSKCVFFPYQQHLCEKEESEGRQLLTTFPGLFVSNSDEDIKIDISASGDGWEVIGSNLMVRKEKTNVHYYMIT